MNMINLKGKTIAQLLPNFQSGGAERTALEMGKAVIEGGGKAVIFSNGGRLVGEAENQGIKHIQMPLHSKNPFIMFKNFLLLKQYFTKEDVSLIHARSRAPAWSGYFAAKALNLPFITTFHGLYGSTNALKRLYNSVMVKGAAVIANSHFTAEFIKKHYQAKRIVTINRGVSEKEFNAVNVSQEAISALKTRLNISDDKPILFMPARFSKQKGHELALEAVSMLTPRPHLVFAGDGNFKFDAQYKDLFIAAGHISDMPTAYALATLVLVPSLKPEGFGRIAIEAGAMGKPVICTPLGAMQETVINGVTGWHVRLNDAQDLREKIETALKLPNEKLSEMGKAAKKHILENYSLNSMISSTLMLYLDLLDHKH